MKAVYRVVAAVAALCTIPAFYFLKLIHIVVDVSLLNVYFDDSFSLKELIADFGGGDVSLSSFKLDLNAEMLEAIAPLKTRAILTLVFFAIVLLMVLAVFFCSCFTNARKLNLIFSVVGCVAAIATIVSFNGMADMVIDGTVSLGSIINALLADSESTLGSLANAFGLGNAVSLIGAVKTIQLEDAIVAPALIFGFIAMWSLAFILVDLDEQPKLKETKKQRKN